MNYFLLILLILIASVSSYLMWNAFAKSSKSNLDVKTIALKINERVFNVEVADDAVSRTQGLMNRESLAEDAGMLFVFDMDGIYPFWMKNTLIPLDMLWLNSNKEIVYIKENAQPCANVVSAICNAVVPNKMAKYVLELNAGDVAKYGVKVGDELKFVHP